MMHSNGQPLEGPGFNARMQEYLRCEVGTAVEMMIRDNTAFHLFDVDKNGQFVFIMAIIPKSAVASFEEHTRPSEALSAATPGPRKME